MHDADSNSLAARIDMRDRWVETEPVRIDTIIDRIGGGDAFAAGVLHGLSTGMSTEEIADFALTTSLLKHSTPGDAGVSSVSDVVAAMGSEFDVRR
ncbi:PfkB family carbohydrate kinase [Sphingomonas sp. 1P08PE]|uniref:PfkB family carbohydrate kinase n=1 Tax=Sphingomonas sp. 1P08PE TaxID=554122 RepID=UPI0039A38E53